MSDYQNTRVIFSKTGPSAYISHLDLMRVFQRALIRAGLDVWHTEGFNPHPYVSFAQPLSVGFESGCEILDFRLSSNADCDALPELLNKVLPFGILVSAAFRGGSPVKHICFARYIIRLSGGDFEPEAVKTFFSAPVHVQKKSKRGESLVDITPMIASLDCVNTPEGLNIDCILKSAPDGSLNPEYIKAALSADAGGIKLTAFYTRTGFYDENLARFKVQSPV